MYASGCNFIQFKNTDSEISFELKFPIILLILTFISIHNNIKEYRKSEHVFSRNRKKI
jgi:hypothetical protein